MAVIPSSVLFIWLNGALSIGLISGAFYLLRTWYRSAWLYDKLLDRTVFAPTFGWNGQTALLVAGIAIALLTLAGGVLLPWLGALFQGSANQDAPNRRRTGQVYKLPRPDGTTVHVEEYGPSDAPVLIFLHGWGADSTVWYYAKRELSKDFRLLIADIRGLGLSTRPKNRDYRVEAFAQDLYAIVGLAKQPAILIGHSAGGMAVLDFCRLYPALLGSAVAGLVLAHTTPRNPVRTTTMAGLMTALERPVMVPLLYLMVWLSPLLRVTNWLNYLNGSAQLGAALSGFSSRAPWSQINFAAQYSLYTSPAVIARGMLGMLKYDARQALAQISVPTLITTGAQDPVCLPATSQALDTAIWDSHLHTFTPAKHMGILEHHAAFAAAVRQFANECVWPHKAVTAEPTVMQN